LEFFTLRHRALNRAFEGWVSSFIMGCYDYVSGEDIWSSVCVESK